MNDPIEAIAAAIREGAHVSIGGAGSELPQRSEIIEFLRERSEPLDQQAEELRALVTDVDATQLLNAIQRRTSLAYSSNPAGAAPILFTWDAKMEFLHGLAVTTKRADRPPEIEEIDAAMATVDSLFDSTQAALVLEAIESSDDYSNALAAVGLQLRLEKLVDRMEGYAKHLEIIYGRLFEPLRAECTEALGFCPADVAPMVRRHVRATNDRLEAGRDKVFRYFEAGSPLPDASELTPEELAQIRYGLVGPFEAHLWDVSDVSETSGLPEETVIAVLTSMASRWECQPEFLTPFDDNSCRTHPVTPLESDVYWVPRPWDLLHALLGWWQATVDPSFQLVETFHRTRDRVLESIVASELAKVFGPESVHRNQFFVGEDRPGEVDVLVAIPEMPIVVECKAGSLTPAGRDGRLDRVGRRVDDLVRKGLEQTEAVAAYVAQEGLRFSSSEGGPISELLGGSTFDTKRVVVTFERMDPLAHRAADLVADLDPGAWVVGLADLLMVTELLPHPTEALAYIDRRAEIGPSKVAAVMEADLLGLFLDDRLDALLSADSEDIDRVLVGYSSASINYYFTMEELGERVDPPRSGLPAPIREVLSSYGRGWGEASVAVMAVPPDEWARWEKVTRRRARRQVPRVSYTVDETGLTIDSLRTATAAHFHWDKESKTIEVPLHTQ